jgi:hypothetical protein
MIFNCVRFDIIFLYFIIVIICGILISNYFFDSSDIEHMTSEVNNACQNVASIYNTGNMSVNNLTSVQSLSPQLALTKKTDLKPQFNITTSGTDDGSYLLIYNQAGGTPMSLGQGGDAYFTGGVYAPTFYGKVNTSNISINDGKDPKFNIYAGDYLRMSNGSGGELLTVGQGGDWYFAPNTQGILSLPLIQATNARFDNFRAGNTIGAYLINGGGGSYPILTSIGFYPDQMVANDADDFYLVMPGYKITVCNRAIADTVTPKLTVTFDNTSGTLPKYYSMTGTDVGPNSGSSCTLYYMGVEIPFPK